MDITPQVLDEFKQRMHITHGAEDENLKRLLSFSYIYIQSKCGEFLLDENQTGKELVFERTRYVYNDAAEYFDDNFLSMINGFSIENIPVTTTTTEGDTNA